MVKWILNLISLALYNFSDNTIECPYSKPTECTNSFCLSKQNIVNLSKRRGPFSFHKQNKYSKLAEHFEYNHIPAHLSSVQNLHFKSILCTRNGLAIVHLARNLITQFGIVDLHIHKFLGTFGRQSVKYSPDSVAARISPDSSLCLIRLPWSRISRVTTLQVRVFHLPCAFMFKKSFNLYCASICRLICNAV